MPHLTIDYSPNLEKMADIAGLCKALRSCAASLEMFPETGVRVRAFRADHCALGNADPEIGYIDISVRLREGRPQAVKEAATAALFAAAKAYLAELLATRPVMLSLEMRDIDARLAPKVNTVPDWLEGRSSDG